MNPRSGPIRWLARLPRGVRRIIIITVSIHLALFVLSLVDNDLFQSVFAHLALTPRMLEGLEIQGLVTSIFVHDPHNIFHVLLNMAGLYFLGPIVERRLGYGNFLVLYLFAGISGSVVYCAWAFAFSDPGIPVIGASGAVLGVLTAFAILFPNIMIRLWMFAPMKARNLIWLALGIDVVMLFSDSQVAVPAHLGGMLGGFLLIRRPWRPEYRRRVAAEIRRLMEGGR